MIAIHDFVTPSIIFVLKRYHKSRRVSIKTPKKLPFSIPPIAFSHPFPRRCSASTAPLHPAFSGAPERRQRLSAQGGRSDTPYRQNISPRCQKEKTASLSRQRSNSRNNRKHNGRRRHPPVPPSPSHLPGNHRRQRTGTSIDYDKEVPRDADRRVRGTGRRRPREPSLQRVVDKGHTHLCRQHLDHGWLSQVCGDARLYSPSVSSPRCSRRGPSGFVLCLPGRQGRRGRRRRRGKSAWQPGYGGVRTWLFARGWP